MALTTCGYIDSIGVCIAVEVMCVVAGILPGIGTVIGTLRSGVAVVSNEICNLGTWSVSTMIGTLIIGVEMGDVTGIGWF